MHTAAIFTIDTNILTPQYGVQYLCIHLACAHPLRNAKMEAGGGARVLARSIAMMIRETPRATKFTRVFVVCNRVG